MTKSEKNELTDIKNLLSGIFNDKYDPGNGWKTARAVFENDTVNVLKSIDCRLCDMKTVTDQIPDLIHTVNDNLTLRRKINKVLLWFGMGISTPILAGIGYLIFRIFVHGI